MRLIIVFFIFCFLMPPTLASLPSGIDWYQGNVEKAFEKAKKESKPLFLYWGAVWCPPCNQIKNVVFSSDEFKSTIKQFIPVYLDGDSTRAQIWSEKLGAKGYPTMIIFSPTAVEVMRLPTGLTALEYSRLMTTALNQMKPIKDILKLVATKEMKAIYWQLLANYSWIQDHGQVVKESERVDLFKKLYDAVPISKKGPRYRLFLIYLNELAEKRVKNVDLKSLQREFEIILSNRDLIKANFENMAWGSKKLLEYLYRKNSIEKKISVGRILQSFKNDKDLSYDERMSSLALSVMSMDHLSDKDKKLLQKEVLALALLIDRETENKFDRHAALSTAVYLLKKAKKFPAARKLALQESKGVNGYYFMSSLASLEKELGRKQEALQWRKKAWSASKGQSTRFQWGTSYLLDLIELEANNSALIESSFNQVFKEALRNQDALQGRNFARYKRLNNALNSWSKDPKRKKAFDQLVTNLKELCPKKNNQCQQLISDIGKKKI